MTLCVDTHIDSTAISTMLVGNYDLNLSLEKHKKLIDVPAALSPGLKGFWQGGGQEILQSWS